MSPLTSTSSSRLAPGSARRSFAAVVAAGSLVASFAALVPALPAAADPALTITVFAADDFTPSGTAQVLADTLAAGGRVGFFDGDDGSATAWAAALESTDVLVIPAASNTALYIPGGTAAMSDAAAAEVGAWVAEGHRVLVTAGFEHYDLFDALTGLPYSDEWTADGPTVSWANASGDPSLPETLPSRDISIGQNRYDEWSEELRAPVTAVYLGSGGTDLGLGSFAAGDGEVIYYAYDWADDTPLLAADPWNAVLLRGATDGFGPRAPQPAPAPGTPEAPAVASASITLDATIGQRIAGTTTRIVVTGLRAGSPYSVTLRSTPRVLASGAVPANGAIDQVLTIPPGLERGWHSVTFASTSVDGRDVTTAVWFEISATGALLRVSATAPSGTRLAETGAEPLLPASAAVLLLLAGVAALAVRRRTAS